LSVIDAVDRLAALLRAHPGTCNWTGGLSDQDIVRAETELDATFPPSYRRFLALLGSCEADGAEFLGVHRTPACGDVLLGTVSATLDARRDLRFPQHLLVIAYDGMGGLVSLDLSRRDERGENPVVVWDPGAADRGGPELLAPAFGTCALDVCERHTRA
jgi:hypothetical protein